MALTYEPIASTTLSSSQSTINFTSIPGTYTDLKIILVFKYSTGNSGDARIRFNSDTASNYSLTYLVGIGTSATSSQATNQTMGYVGPQTVATVNDTISSLTTVDIFSYAGSTFKSFLSTNSNDKNGTGEVNAQVQLWRSTSAITSISLFTSSTTWASGTIATLYGIKAA